MITEIMSIDIKEKHVYLSFQPAYSTVTSEDSSAEYLELRNQPETVNHLELFGKDAINFDKTLNSIVKPNDLMKSVLDEVYENIRSH